MTQMERQLLDALLELEAKVQSVSVSASGASPTATTPRSTAGLGQLFARIDELAAALPADCDPNLRHYLERKSYQKAQRFLEGQSADKLKGTCGKRH